MCVYAPAQTCYALLNKLSTMEWNPTGSVMADARTTTQRAFTAYSAQAKNSAQTRCGSTLDETCQALGWCAQPQILGNI